MVHHVLEASTSVDSLGAGRVIPIGHMIAQGKANKALQSLLLGLRLRP